MTPSARIMKTMSCRDPLFFVFSRPHVGMLPHVAGQVVAPYRSPVFCRLCVVFCGVCPSVSFAARDSDRCPQISLP